MPRSPIEDLAISELIDPDKLGEPARPLDLSRNVLGLHGELHMPTAESAPFRATSVDGRLAEIDDVLGAGEAPVAAPAPASPLHKRASGARSLPRATGSTTVPTLDATAVHPAVRALPGGHAFALLLPGRPAGGRGPSDVTAPRSGELLPNLPNPRELYLRVREFLRELRAGLFGFQRELVRTAELHAQLRMQLDSDVELSLAGSVPSAAASQQITVAIVRAADAMRDALALFAKVIEIVAALVKAARHPVHAVRTLYQALRGLYELLVAHFAARA